MTELKDYIYLHKSLLNTAIWNTQEKFTLRSAWIDLLLLADHDDEFCVIDEKEIVIHSGQYLTTKKKLAVRWGVTEGTVYRWLNELENANMICVDSTNRYSLITIQNCWENEMRKSECYE